jgi:hypothetical protein
LIFSGKYVANLKIFKTPFILLVVNPPTLFLEVLGSNNIPESSHTEWDYLSSATMNGTLLYKMAEDVKHVACLKGHDARLQNFNQETQREEVTRIK